MKSSQLFIGVISEGPTDNRFLFSIVKRSIDEIIFAYGGTTEIYIEEIKKDTGKSFVNQIIDANRNHHRENFINILLIHNDSDHKDDSKVLNDKFNPLMDEIKSIDNEVICKEIIPIIPVQMIEAWMLADIDLFLDVISAAKNKADLKLNGNPESFTDPKDKIKKALQIINQEKPKKRRKDLQINELYQLIGQKIEIEKLLELNSFRKFHNNLISSLNKLKFIYKQ
ncbi:DUF4276 family protein [Chryseobacterium populi]|uniref:DUF4276 domain-containing protein n=1 Tax=Chryseobacterium populi TaxID=1144316 RepID=J2T4R2_9FLAO|nr:DUF4276 family protein [Chryseobacterium populi]EJL73017.1 hypothetical protein PMI13_01725 [Chryseobacterium populi]